MRQLYLIGYDISGNTPRRRALHAIKGNAIGGQKSVYECWLTESELRDAREELNRLIDSHHDRVVFTRLDTRAMVHTLGVAQAPHDGEIFYQG